MMMAKLCLCGFLSLVIALSMIAVERSQHWNPRDRPHAIPVADSSTRRITTQRYVLDASQSKFTAHALAGGLLWFKGHDHLIAIPDFNGEATLTPDTISPASLKITARAGSMVETNSVFTE